MKNLRYLLGIKHQCFLPILLIVISLSSCKLPVEEPTNFPAHIMGAGGGGATVASDYWYPHHRGLVIVYSNTDSCFDVVSSSVTVTHGSSDTLRSLGFQGMSPSGDSLFAVVATYQVSGGSAGRGGVPLRYLPASSGFPGAFIDASATLTGEITTSLPASRAVANDSVAGALAGRIRSLYGSFASGPKIWQHDTILFTSIGDSVLLWNHTGVLGALAPFKSIFLRSLATGDNWKIATDLDSSSFTVESTSISETVPAGCYSAIQIGVNSPQYHLPITENKFLTTGIGVIRQEDTWNVTTDGQSIRIHKLTMEASAIVKDEDEG